MLALSTMEKIQIAINDASYRAALARVLSQNAPCEVVCVDELDQVTGGVLVVDFDHLDQLRPIRRPERVVLVANKNPDSLTRAWEAGVNSVVYDRDPLSTAVLAILSARLRAAKAPRTTERLL
jgi:hypothetical protein